MQATEQKSQATDFEPDVWWGPDGIDALIWADSQPYADPWPDDIAAESTPDREAGQAQIGIGTDGPRCLR